MSPGAWLLSRRVTEARTLLEQTDLPVEAIAARVGLASAVNLRRHFRNQLGTTPGAYRRAFRGHASAPNARQAPGPHLSEVREAVDLAGGHSTAPHRV
jgi:AraC-like DNA-binding protein